VIINIRAISFKTLTNMIINIRTTSFKTLTKRDNQHKDYEVVLMLIIMLVNVLNEIALMLIITFS
jgi:hypothetical protein